MVKSFSHFTASADTVLKILENGFAWVPNKRFLISDLIPQHDFRDREPQAHGMISFTDSAPRFARYHHKKFGQYGIVMTEKWGQQQNIRKVFYLKNSGFAFNCIKLLFQAGYKDLKSRIKYPEDSAWNMSYTNKSVALNIVGSKVWHDLLTFYEYLEPKKNQEQREWRIVNPLPLYGFSDSKKDVIKNVDPPQNWATVVHVVPFKPIDTEALICPDGKQDELRLVLPTPYKDKEILGI